jgi:hypothetical protein
MKKCPKCNRTYADDAFTFCLEDGALLSAPYDPKSEKPISTIQSGGPPPTAVLPSGLDSEETEARPATLPPTIASHTPSSVAPEPKPFVPPRLESNVSASKRSKLLYIVISLSVLVLIVVGISVVTFKSRLCPKIDVVCDNISEKSARCYLAPEKKVKHVTWSSSTGTIIASPGDSEMMRITTGLAGQRITVKATYTSDSWLCSGTASTSYAAK